VISELLYVLAKPMKNWHVWRNALKGVFVGTILTGVLTLESALAQTKPIEPPFGLRWGEDSKTIERLLKGAGATVVEKRKVEGREAWTVEGLIQASLKRTVFYFKKEQLVEVELQYEENEWDAMKYNDFMSAVRRKIESKYGTGRLIARQKTPKDGVIQTLVGYKWEQNNTAIQLIYFAAESADFDYRSVSVHYKGFY
jgi:hypothetical protein